MRARTCTPQMGGELAPVLGGSRHETARKTESGPTMRVKRYMTSSHGNATARARCKLGFADQADDEERDLSVIEQLRRVEWGNAERDLIAEDDGRHEHYAGGEQGAANTEEVVTPGSDSGGSGETSSELYE